MLYVIVQDPGRVQFYKSMGQEDLWLDCAEKLTAMIQNIIEFAKLIPGFMRLSQDDQVRIHRTCVTIFTCSHLTNGVRPDSSVEDRLIRAGHRANVAPDGPVHKLRAVR